MYKLLPDVDRVSLIKGTALYLVVYTVLNSCVGIGFALIGRLSQSGFYSVLLEQAPDDFKIAASATDFQALGTLSLTLGIFSLISVPVFAAAAWGLWKRKAWARIGTIIALAFTFVLSLTTLSTDSSGFIWMLISGFGIYLYWTDAGIRQELNR